MIELKLELDTCDDVHSMLVPVSFHTTFASLYKRLVQCIQKLRVPLDESIVNDLILFYSFAKKKYLDHRDDKHLLRLVLSLYYMQRKLSSSSTLFSHTRHLVTRWMPTNLIFPFSSKPVLGCLVGFNVMDRCELFDEENVVVALQKNFPDLRLVKESYYRHNSPHENLKLFYFEIEKKNSQPFSLLERKLLRMNLEEKIKNSIQIMVPSVFMKLNQEEVYKNVLILSQEITSIHDLPQVYITLEQHTGKEISFHVSLVQISPFHKFLFKDRLFGCSCVLERMLPVRYLEGRPIEAYLFRILLPCESSLLRSDGSLDFYVARQKVVSLLKAAVGDFRDYNGGLLIKQQEQLYSFKQCLPEQLIQNEEFMEKFFHALVPLEKQALLDPKVLSRFFIFFLDHQKRRTEESLSFKIERESGRVFISIRGADSSIIDKITSILRTHLIDAKEWAYNVLELAEGIFFNCVLLDEHANKTESFLHALQTSLYQWRVQSKSEQGLRAALGYSIFSLDPRVGGESMSSNVLRFLFEGLTRYDQDGNIENAVAETIEISLDAKVYTFRLRSCFWNEGSLISAHDFVYAWKKILSPDFKTNFAGLFYPIKNAKEAKEGKAPIDDIGIYAINDRILQVELIRPTPYFLQLTAHPIFSPVHRFIDQERPQWPYQHGKNYPCNGPFQLKMNQPNRGYQLVRNPMYWDAPQIHLDYITLIPMDSQQAIQAFSKREIDWVGNPFGLAYNLTAPSDQGQILSCPDTFVSWFIFNTKVPPLQNLKVRKAFSLVLDRSELIKDMNLSLKEAYSVLHPRYCEHRSAMYHESNLELARKLLEEGLAEEGLSLDKFSLQISYHPNGSHGSLVAVLKKQLCEKLKIACHLQAFSWDSFFYRMTEGKFQVGIMNWTTPIDDPIFTLNAFKFSQEGINFSNWEKKEYQELLDASEDESNPFQRSLYLHKAEQILSDEVPVIPLYYQSSEALVRSNFHINSQQHANRGFFNLSRGYFNKELNYGNHIARI